MSRSLTASDRASLIKLAGSLPKGDEDRRAILARVAGDFRKFERKGNKLILVHKRGKGVGDAKLTLTATNTKSAAKVSARFSGSRTRPVYHYKGEDPEKAAKDFLQGLEDFARSSRAGSQLPMDLLENYGKTQSPRWWVA